MAAKSNKKAVIALGFFDGVHLGHGQLINMAKQRAEEIGASAAVLSFDISPEAVITGKIVPLISSTKTRADLISRFYGVDKVIFYHFDKEIMAMPWRNFIDSLILEFSAVHFVIGHDFHCGYKGEGNPNGIADYCRSQNIGCDIIPKFDLDNITVSSSYIRSLIADGDIQRANYFLGHPYSVSGKVRAGLQNGRKMGTPTTNIYAHSELLLPPFGVYATKILFDGLELPAVTNVGVRPTFGDSDKVSIESFILDFSGDLYEKNVTVDFYKFLRPEKRFDSPDELRQAIEKNAEETKALFT